MRAIYTLAVVFLFVAGAACGGKDADTAKPRNIELAPAMQGQPQLNDVAPVPAAAPTPAPKAPARSPERAPLQAPRATSPAPQGTAPVAAAAPAMPQPAPQGPPQAAPQPAVATAAPTGTVEAGVHFAVKPAARICTTTHKAGDRFTAALGEAVQGSNGVVIPAGSLVVLRVVESASTTNAKAESALSFDVIAVRIGNDSYPVDGKVTPTAPLERVGTESLSDQAKTTAKGAAIGAIAGQVLGKNTKSTVLGAVIGGVAGAMTASGTNQYEGCLKADGTLTIALDKPLTIKVPTKP